MANMRISDDLIEYVIQSVRVTQTEAAEAEVTALIRAAVVDLSRQGVDEVDLSDPLIIDAVKLYVKANYGYDKDAERFMRAYEGLSASLALSSDYDTKGGE